MHGLLNRSIQCFVRDTYGSDTWRNVAELAGLGAPGFEAMLRYDDGLTYAVTDAAVGLLGQERGDFLQNLGAYLVSHENVAAVRRLLRFGGENFEEFLHSLEELPDRVRMAVPDLEFPRLVLRDCGHGRFLLRCLWDHQDFGHVVIGVLRGMADDYGALVFLEFREAQQGEGEEIEIIVAEARFTEGRSFRLAGGVE